MSKSRFLINLKLMWERSKMYISAVQFVFIVYLFILQSEWNFYSTVLLIALIMTPLTIIDFKWIYPAEQRRVSEKNPILMEIRSDIKELKKQHKN